MRLQTKKQEENKEKVTHKENKEDDNTKIILTANQVFIPDDWGQIENFLDLNHLNLNNEEESNEEKKRDEDGDTIPELLPRNDDDSLDTWEHIPDFPQANYQPWVFLDDILDNENIIQEAAWLEEALHDPDLEVDKLFSENNPQDVHQYMGIDTNDPGGSQQDKNPNLSNQNHQI